MADYATALVKILRHEGVDIGDDGKPVLGGRIGLSDHPDDPGGATAYGIIRSVAKENGYAGPMKDIPFPLVKEIYRKRYWDFIHGDEIPDQEIAEEVFDTAVNCGATTAGGFLQRTLNAMNGGGQRWPDLLVDGYVGGKTIAALRKALNTAPYYHIIILRALDGLQVALYIGLAEKDAKYKSFIPGWLRVRSGVKD